MTALGQDEKGSRARLALFLSVCVPAALLQSSLLLLEWPWTSISWADAQLMMRLVVIAAWVVQWGTWAFPLRFDLSCRRLQRRLGPRDVLESAAHGNSPRLRDAAITAAVAALIGTVAAMASTGAAPWALRGRPVDAVVVVIAVAVAGAGVWWLASWLALAGARQEGRSLVAITASTGLCALVAAGAFGGSAFAHVPLGAPYADQLRVYAGRGLHDIRVNVEVGDKQVQTEAGQSFEGVDPVEPTGGVSVTIQASAQPKVSVAFALMVKGRLATGPVRVSGDRTQAVRISEATTSDHTRSGKGDESGIAPCNVAGAGRNYEVSPGEQAQVIRWIATADSAGNIGPVEVQARPDVQWARSAGGGNVIVLPAVLLGNAARGVCDKGEGLLSGEWFAPSGYSTISMTVPGFIPPDASVSKSPRFDGPSPDLRWLMSNGPVSADGRDALPITVSPAALTPSYSITTGDTQQRASASTFVGGVMAGGVVAGLFELVMLTTRLTRDSGDDESSVPGVKPPAPRGRPWGSTGFTGR